MYFFSICATSAANNHNTFAGRRTVEIVVCKLLTVAIAQCRALLLLYRLFLISSLYFFDLVVLGAVGNCHPSSPHALDIGVCAGGGECSDGPTRYQLADSCSLMEQMASCWFRTACLSAMTRFVVPVCEFGFWRIGFFQDFIAVSQCWLSSGVLLGC